MEVEALGDEAQPIAGSFAERVSTSFDAIMPLLSSITRPLCETCRELNREIAMETVEVELGFGFEAEGNVYVTKAGAAANLRLKLILKPADQP